MPFLTRDRLSETAGIRANYGGGIRVSGWEGFSSKARIRLSLRRVSIRSENSIAAGMNPVVAMQRSPLLTGQGT